MADNSSSDIPKAPIPPEGAETDSSSSTPVPSSTTPTPLVPASGPAGGTPVSPSSSPLPSQSAPVSPVAQTQAHVTAPVDSAAVNSGTIGAGTPGETTSGYVSPVSGMPPSATGFPQPSQPTNKKSTSKAPVFLMGIVGVLIGAAIAFGGVYAATDGLSASSTSTIESSGSSESITITPVSEDANLAEAVAAKALPSVVSIDVYASSSYVNGSYGLSSNGDSVDSLEVYGLGSGVVLSEDGYILTNYHVIEGGETFMINFDESTQYEATLVASDESSDLAVLKVDVTGLTPITVADSDEISVGEWVMALGSPFGLEKSVSTGIVSALYRSSTMESTTGVNIYANMIQTDAAINPGNSGGALVNSEGELIGINTLISSYSGSSSGVGFAIPSNYAINIATQLIEDGVVEHAYLGVTLGTVDKASAEYYGVEVDSGAYVGSVPSGSPAETAGIQQGDVITKIDGTAVSTASELIINVRSHTVGDVVSVEVNRDGETMTFDVTLGSDINSTSDDSGSGSSNNSDDEGDQGFQR